MASLPRSISTPIISPLNFFRHQRARGRQIRPLLRRLVRGGVAVVVT